MRAHRREHRQDAIDARVEIELVGAQLELGIVRRLVRVVDAGESGDLAGALPCVQALHVALGAHGDRGRDPDLDEPIGLVGGALGMASPHLVTRRCGTAR